MEDLRILTLTQCNNLPFILALSPDRNPSKCALWFKLEELILYVEELELFNIKSGTAPTTRCEVLSPEPYRTSITINQIELKWKWN